MLCSDAHARPYVRKYVQPKILVCQNRHIYRFRHELGTLRGECGAVVSQVMKLYTRRPGSQRATRPASSPEKLRMHAADGNMGPVAQRAA